MSSGQRTLSQRITDLDRHISSDQVTVLPRGRAYINSDGFHIDQIHLPLFAENSVAQNSLRQAFLNVVLPERGIIYGGIGGFANILNIAAIRPSKAVLFDINPVQIAFWNDVVIPGLATHKILDRFLADFLNHATSKSRRLMQEFKAVAHSRGQIIPEHFLSVPFRDLKSFSAWAGALGMEDALCEHYDHLHALAHSGALAALTLDIADTQGCRNLRTAAIPQGFDLLYVSNVFDFLGKPGRVMMDWACRELDEEQYNRAHDNVIHLLNEDGAYVIDETGETVSVHFPDYPVPRDWAVPILN